MRTLVFIPAWNEADSIPGVISGVRESIPHADVLVIDDGSRDATVASSLQAGARVASLPFNQGLGAALQTGYLYALREGYDACAHLDADGQHPPSEVARLLAEIEADRADLVIGSRYRDAGSPGDAAAGGADSGAEDAAAGGAGVDSGIAADDDYRATLTRQIGINLFGFFLSLATRQRFTDTTSGMRAANRKVMELFSERYSPDFAELESLQRAVREGLRVEEIPVRMLPRAQGSSFLTPLKSSFFIFKNLIVLLVGHFRPRDAKDSR